ncbi:hypothetical protein FISHEDRAFT_64930 [Fistulina hepatica ATCC 64428]|uniref:2-hydroxyacid dehydrogenase n=1 Tax=Fistulina hepatica ATCC 64428 TaxID=1128425 RepID=A0A0D7AG75_9AGAR|nr:hypothetical protein FISHEDRAFT_64930 [Fistulina hepatica ATCC 64428]
MLEAHKPRVLFCGTLKWAAEDAKAKLGDIAELIHMEQPCDRKTFLAKFQPGGPYAGTIAIFRHTSSSQYIGHFDAELLDGMPGVKWIAHTGAGYDQIDVFACKDRAWTATGIRVSNTPNAVDEGTATTCLYLLISSMRAFPLAEESLRAGYWKFPKISPYARDISCLNIAILGLGGIGLYFANLLRPFAPKKIMYHNRKPRRDPGPEWLEYMPDVEEMLSQADVLSVHVPLNPNTVGLVGEKWIRKLRKGAIIINTARGKIIDEAAMISALEDGHLSSVGLDVFPDEPKVNPRLLEFPQVTLLPHMGTETRDSQHRMEIRALDNIKDFLTTGAGRDLVPEHNDDCI